MVEVLSWYPAADLRSGIGPKTSRNEAQDHGEGSVGAGPCQGVSVRLNGVDGRCWRWSRARLIAT